MFISRIFFSLFVVIGLCATLGCSILNRQSIKQFHLGDRVTVGPVSYVGLSAEYRNELPGATESRKNTYLVIQLSATNDSGQVVTLPHTRLLGSGGEEYPEVSSIGEFPGWFGSLRRLDPAATERGYIVFDVPVGAYKLEVSGGGDPEQAQLAHIEVPANLAPATLPGVPGPPLGQ